MSKYFSSTQSLDRLENNSSSAFIIAICISCFIHFGFFSLENNNEDYSLVQLPLQVIVSQIDSPSKQNNRFVEAPGKSTADKVKTIDTQIERLNSHEKPESTIAENKLTPFVKTPAHKPQGIDHAQNKGPIVYSNSLQNTLKNPASETTTQRTSSILRKASYLNNPSPNYPGRARKMGLEGQLLLRVRVLQNGTSDQLIMKKSSGSSLLDNAALRAVRNWQFIPAYQGDKTISSWVEIPIRFKLDTY